MKKGIKIVTIGGGSSYTPELIEGFIKRYDELPVSEIWLVDIEEGKEKLEIVGDLAKRMVKKSALPIEVHLTLNRREALIDADFVTTQLRVGQLDARVLDEKIPAKYGMLGQETNGAGGLFKALRTIPVIMDIIKDVKELCPNAWIINFTNPAGIVTEAALKYGGFERFIGVCNVPINMKKHFAKLLNVTENDIRVDFGGLNHMSYAFHAYVNGEDKIAEIIDKMKESQMTMNNIDPLAWDIDFLKALNAIPSPYHKYYYKAKEMLDKSLIQYEEGKTRAEVVKEVEKKLFEKYKNPELNEKPKELEKRGGAYYSDVACNVISSIYNDKGDYQTVNTVNLGNITTLPYGCAIEVTAKITKNGPIPVTLGELPTAIAGLVQHMKAFEELTCEAAIKGDKAKALLALQMNPLTTSDAIAKKVFDELFVAHSKYLTQFK